MAREALTDEKLSPDFVEIVVIQVRKRPDKDKGEQKRERLLRVMLNETKNLSARERTELRNRLHQVAIDYIADLEAGAFGEHAQANPTTFEADVARLSGAPPAARGPAPKRPKGRRGAAVERLPSGLAVADVELLRRMGVQPPTLSGPPVPMTPPIERGAEAPPGRVAVEDRAYELGAGEALEDAR